MEKIQQDGYSKSDKINIYNGRKLDPTKMWILFLFLGWSYGSMGSMGKQILYYITFGGLTIWAIYLLFTLNGKIKKYNKNIALEVGLDGNDLMKMGL
jgi:hypothetical protein